MDEGNLGGGTAAELAPRASTALPWAPDGMATYFPALAASSAATPPSWLPTSSSQWPLPALPLRPVATPPASLPSACVMGGARPQPLLMPLPSALSPPAPGAPCAMPRRAAWCPNPRRRRRAFRTALPPSLAAVLSLEELGAVAATAAATESPRPPGSPLVAQLPLAVLLSSTASAGEDAAALFSVDSVAAADADGVGDA